MKKIFSLVASLSISMVGMAQDVTNFEVGPYEVEYNKGTDDYRYDFRDGIDLYDYYDLKKDTIIQVSEVPSEPVDEALQFNVSMSLPRYNANGTSNVFGIDGSWKQKIGNRLYLNGGLSVALSFGKYGDRFCHYKDWEHSDSSYTETLFEVGVPLSIEYSNLDYKKSSLYGGIGVVPTFYTGAKDPNGKSKSGLYIAPRLDAGAYIPMGDNIIKVGLFVQYDINCSGGDYDIFKERIGRLFVGANVGVIL